MYSIHQDNRRYNTSSALQDEGLAVGFTQQKEGHLLLTSKEGVGHYFLKGLDTEEYEMSFNRLRLKDNFEKGMKLTIYILVQDSPYGEYEGNIVDIDEFLQCENALKGELHCKKHSFEDKAECFNKVSPNDKLTFMMQQGAKIYSNHTDILLHGLIGRYIWIAIKSYNAEDKPYSLYSLQIEYPMQTFVDYLPQVYSEGDDFFQRYMGIFQSLYLDVEQEIDQLPLYLDVETMPERFLNYVGKWVGIDNSSDIFNPKQMRQMIKRADSINGGKGTKTALEELIEIYTGTKPIIIEYFEWKNLLGSKQERKQLYKQLYGEDMCWFTVIADMSKAPKETAREVLNRLIGQYKPAMTKYHLFLLEPCNRSDLYCYLGVNSYLAKPDRPQVDQGVLLTGEIVL